LDPPRPGPFQLVPAHSFYWYKTH